MIGLTNPFRVNLEFENLLAAQGAMPQQGVGEQPNAMPCPMRAHRLDGSEFLVANGATADMADLLLVRPGRE